MFDIKKVEEEARKEVMEEQSKAAKDKIKASLKNIENAKKVLANAQMAHEVLLRDIGA
jgi:hypothetical protein